ncbi:regulator [Vibrio cionasavignyae]|uniref:regulator n=1 Tax=Vibrio cionasavignyae TaxID=2910252 RepID=UPI003D0A28CA
MRYLSVTDNYIFRQMKCGISPEMTAKLCFKTLKDVRAWDKGKPIPPECKRLIRMYAHRELGIGDSWEGFEMVGEKLHLPTGQMVSAQQILTGIALIEINSELEIKTTSKLLQFSRAITKIKLI